MESDSDPSLPVVNLKLENSYFKNSSYSPFSNFADCHLLVHDFGDDYSGDCYSQFSYFITLIIKNLLTDTIDVNDLRIIVTTMVDNLSVIEIIKLIINN